MFNVYNAAPEQEMAINEPMDDQSLMSNSLSNCPLCINDKNYLLSCVHLMLLSRQIVNILLQRLIGDRWSFKKKNRIYKINVDVEHYIKYNDHMTICLYGDESDLEFEE